MGIGGTNVLLPPFSVPAQNQHSAAIQFVTGGRCSTVRTMAPTKETLPATTTDTAVSQTNTRGKRDSAHMRSDAVSLEVPVKVHGSRLNDSALGATPKSEPFEEQTSTMIVFPQGGVLKMATPVTTGQMMVVTNLKSGHDSICRVVKVRAYGAGQSYVEVEFTHRQPGYWGVYFPSDGPEATSQLIPIPPATPAATPASLELRIEKRPPPDPSASVPKPPIAKSAGPADSVFAPIGSQEQVQPAASATSSRVKPISIVEHASKSPDFATAGSPIIDSLSVAPSSPVASVSLDELQGDAEAAPALSFAGAGVPGEVAEDPLPDSTPVAEHSAPLGHFATALGAPESTQSKGKHGAAIALSAAALIALAAGTAYYFQWVPLGTKSAAKPAATVPAPAEVPVTAVTPQTNLIPQGLNPASSSLPANSATVPPATTAAVAGAPSPKVNAATPAPLRSSKSAPEAPPAAAPVTANPPSKVPDMFVALNAHPTSRTYSSDSGAAEAAAPTVDSGGSDGGLSAIASSSVVPPPSEEQEAPVRIRVGGAIKPPRLLSSVLPVYPAVARETGIEGDVVIDTTIDKTGKVTGMKVVSGNAMLRQAALDALRQWKYEPSKLNGEAVPVQLTVTIKFHRQ